MPRFLLDVIRWGLIIGATSLSVERLSTVHWLLGLVLSIPLFVVYMNIFGFLTLPLYGFTIEAIAARKELKDIIESPLRKRKKIASKFRLKAKIGDKCGLCGRKINKSEEVIVVNGKLICNKCEEKLPTSKDD